MKLVDKIKSYSKLEICSNDFNYLLKSEFNKDDKSAVKLLRVNRSTDLEFKYNLLSLNRL